MAEHFLILWRAFARRLSGPQAALARLTPAARERAFASAVFAGIFAFAALSVDYLITGGPDWNPGAGEPQSVQIPERVAATSLRVVSVAPPPALPETLSDEVTEFDEPIAALLGGPELEWTPVGYEVQGAPGQEFYGPSEAGKELEIAHPTEAAFTFGKAKPPATHS